MDVERQNVGARGKFQFIVCRLYSQRCAHIRIGLYVLLIVYLILGILVIRYVESGKDVATDVPNITQLQLELIEELRTLNFDRENDSWAPLAMEKLSNFTQFVEDAIQKSSTASHAPDWSVLSSLVFCLTVMTTIGYGHVTPATGAGKAFSVAYAALGVPLMLLFLAHIGKLLAKLANSLYMKLRAERKTKTNLVSNVVTVNESGQMSSIGDNFSGTYVWDGARGSILKTGRTNERSRDRGSQVNEEDLEPVTETSKEYEIPAYIVLSAMTAFILIGSVVDSQWHDWSYNDSVYFNAMTLLTIGFGDILPRERSSFYFIYWCAYVLTGLSMMSMCLNLLQKRFTGHVRRLGRLLFGL
ncbi:TWiK family of potassium channels protein 7-like [Ptychodera flava]|uniref:TWiK family of potassium channels protein 7-like n=1 Tax=Ptychodera flava TaxID=63121 RepID=UPI00396A8677